MLEKDIENLIAKHPDEFFPNSGFKLIGQQVKLGKCYADIIFEDKYRRNVIVEVKRGILSRDASGQVMEYYGLLKTEAELMAWDYSREFNLPMVSLRFPMVCGEGFYNYKILMKMISNLKNNKPVFLVGNGENRFRQVYLGDVLKAYYLSYTNEKALGKAFNICANDSVKLNDMIAYAKKKYKSNSQIIYLPLKPIQKLLKILKFFGIYVIHPGDLEWLCRDILMDNSKAKKILGFKPTKTTKESLEILVDSFLKMDEDILSRDADNPFV